MKNKRIVLGLVLGLVFGVLGAIFMFSSPPVQKAEATTMEDWTCKSNGPQCGANIGTQYVCPETYTRHENTCRKWVATVYTCDGLVVDLGGSERNASIFYGKNTGDDDKCHRIVWDNLSADVQGQYKTWHGYSNNWLSSYNTHIDEWRLAKVKTAGAWEYTTKVAQSCTAGDARYDSCDKEGTCPTECGYDGGTVPDGKGGSKTCEPTNSCSTRRWCFPDEESPTGFVAEAIPSNKTPDEGKPWESGKMVDKYCAYLPAGQCPTACGLGASEVDDGKGGKLQCQATSACEQPKQENTSSGGSSPSSPSAPQCGETAPVKTGANFHVYRKGGDAILKWFPTEGGQANIYYKQVNASDWQYSLRDIANTGYVEIHDLGGLDITFALQQSRGCAGGPLTNAVVDGATDGWVLFR